MTDTHCPPERRASSRSFTVPAARPPGPDLIEIQPLLDLDPAALVELLMAARDTAAEIRQPANARNAQLLARGWPALWRQLARLLELVADTAPPECCGRPMAWIGDDREWFCVSCGHCVETGRTD